MWSGVLQNYNCECLCQQVFERTQFTEIQREMVNSQHDLALDRTLVRLIQPGNTFTSGLMSIVAVNVPQELQLIIISKLT